jgi:hypothetical protein
MTGLLYPAERSSVVEAQEAYLSFDYVPHLHCNKRSAAQCRHSAQDVVCYPLTSCVFG